MPEGHRDGGPVVIEYEVEGNGMLKPFVFRNGAVVELPPDTFTPSTDFVVSDTGSVTTLPVPTGEVRVVVVEDVSASGVVTMRASFVREILVDVDVLESVVAELRDDPVRTEVPAEATTPAIVLEVGDVVDGFPDETETGPADVDIETTSPSAVRDVIGKVFVDEVARWGSTGVVNIAEAVESEAEATSPLTVRAVTVEVIMLVSTLAAVPSVTVVSTVSVTTPPVVARRTAVVSVGVPLLATVSETAVEELAFTSTSDPLNTIPPGNGSSGVIATRMDSELVKVACAIAPCEAFVLRTR